MTIPAEVLHEIGYELARVSSTLSKVDDADWDAVMEIQVCINRAEELLDKLETA